MAYTTVAYSTYFELPLVSEALLLKASKIAITKSFCSVLSKLMFEAGAGGGIGGGAEAGAEAFC